MQRFCVTLLALLALNSGIFGAEPKPDVKPSVSPAVPRQPVLTFDRLLFADKKLQQQVRRFHERGEALAKSDGTRHGYERSRSTPESQWSEYTAWWRSPSWDESLSITLEGPRLEGVDSLSGLRVRASTVSYTEWAAEVEYSVNPLVKGPPRPNVSVSVGRVRGDARSPFDTPRGAQVIRLTGPSVNVSVEQSPQLKYRFHSQYASQRDFAATLDMLYGKPETLRDEMLADIEALRQQAKEQLAKNWHLRIYDERGATSAEPPRETPVFDEQQQPNAATRKALAGEVERKLGAQEAAIRDDFREIHAAVQRALPLRELLDSDASK